MCDAKNNCYILDWRQQRSGMLKNTNTLANTTRARTMRNGKKNCNLVTELLYKIASTVSIIPNTEKVRKNAIEV